jgi:hypothetical protein
MQIFLAALAAVVLLLAGCATDRPADQPPPPLAPQAAYPPAAGPPPSADIPDNAEPPEKRPERVLRPRGSAGTWPGQPTVSPLPSRPSLYSLPAPSLPPGGGGAAPNLGPVTGYGPGGMALPPGVPANPPYR